MKDWIKAFLKALALHSSIFVMVLLATVLSWKAYIGLLFVLIAIISWIGIKVDKWESK